MKLYFSTYYRPHWMKRAGGIPRSGFRVIAFICIAGLIFGTILAWPMITFLFMTIVYYINSPLIKILIGFIFLTFYIIGKK